MVASQSDWRRFRECPKQYRLSQDPEAQATVRGADTSDRQRRSLLGEVVDDTLAEMYAQGRVGGEDLVAWLNQTARARMAVRYPRVSVAESQETLLYELQPVWATVPETVRLEGLQAPAVAVRQDYSLAFKSGHTLKGQPDLVLVHPDHVVVIDVKLRARSSLTFHQLKVYCALVTLTHARPVRAAGYWLPRDAAVHWMRRIPKPEAILAEVEADLLQMAAGESAPSTGSHCAHCEYRPACPEGTAYIREKAGTTLPITGRAYAGRPETVGL